MSGDLVPDPRHVRMSDADREDLVARLNTAVSEGRLTLAEFEERVDGVLRARTYADAEPYLSDLPFTSVPALRRQNRDVVELRTNASSLKRTGRWIVPRRLVVSSRAGSVKLNFTDAVIGHSVIELDVDLIAGSLDLVVPRGSSADLDDVEMIAGSVKSKVPIPTDPTATGPCFVVRGKTRAGSVKVRYERRFWRWRW